MTNAELTQRVRHAALGLGFVRVGFTTATRFDDADTALQTWLAAGFQGEMQYMNKRRADVRDLLDGARTIIVAALPHSQNGITGVARYAVGDDYHLVVREKLETLHRQIEELTGREVAAKICVDSAPLLEREAARRAGVGFVGKSTMAILPGFGSYFVLGELIVDVALRPDKPLRQRCGRCTICIDACPTAAIVEPYRVDARRCISYLTIEHRQPVPSDLRARMGTHLFGCDLCQQACPFNASPKQRPECKALLPRLSIPSLEVLLRAGSNAHRRLVHGTALQRVSRNQLARNAAVALGNTKDAAGALALTAVLDEHPSPLVRLHVAWALGEIGTTDAREALERAASNDPEATVRHEAGLASSTTTGA